MTTLAHVRKSAANAVRGWGGRMAIIHLEATFGESWLFLSSHCQDYGAYVATCEVGEVVMVDGFPAEVVEIVGELQVNMKSVA